MTAFPPVVLLLLAPLALLAALTAPGLAPVWQAFRTRRPALTLAPGEQLLAELRPDPRLLALTGLGVIAVTMAAALAEQLVFGATPGGAYLSLLPFSLAALAHLALDARRGWAVTDRRVVTDLGASLPLDQIGRIAVGPTLVRLDGVGAQSLRLHGLTDAPRAAQMIRDLIARRAA